MRSASNTIQQLLRLHGPGLTSDLAVKFQESGVSADAARKRLSRIPRDGDVKTLYGLPFPKRTRFIYLADHFGTQAYWDSLIAAIEKSSPAYSCALAGIHARGGVVPRSHFIVASGAPDRQKGQISSDTILERLISIGLVARDVIEPIGEVIRLAGPKAGQETTPLRVRLLVEDILINALKKWAVKMNFTSPNTAKIRGDDPTPKYSTFCFDLCGPSYLLPLRRHKDQRATPGFLVGDVVAGTTLTVAHVSPFIRKCKTLSNLRKLRPFMPLFVADGFTSDALRACRGAGIVATTPSTLFGQEAGRALKDLFEALANAAAVAASDPQRIETLFAQLSKVDGIDSNLRGALFEMIVGHMVRSIEGGSIDMGVQVQEHQSGERREIDVRLVREKEIVIYECKGSMPTTKLSEKDTKEWLTRWVPIVLAALRQEERFKNSSFKFALWTSGTFDPGALKLLESARAKTVRYEIEWKDGGAVKSYARKIKAPGIRKILDEHYFDHPLTEIEKAGKKKAPENRSRLPADTSFHRSNKPNQR